MVDPGDSPLFPAIGSLADQTGQLSTEVASTQASGTTEDNVVQEIESLCMKCGEQVRVTQKLGTPVSFLNSISRALRV